MGIWATQNNINEDMVETYLSQMRNGTFSNNMISIMKYNGEYYITDGHSRMTAAYKYYLETKSTFYIDVLIDNARYLHVNPADYGYYKNKRLWR